MARVATGVAAAESWVMSATTTAERRFGDVNVALTEESDGSWQIFVDAGLPSPDGERVDFEVHP
jgi:hypothetical protein